MGFILEAFTEEHEGVCHLPRHSPICSAEDHHLPTSFGVQQDTSTQLKRIISTVCFFVRKDNNAGKFCHVSATQLGGS